MPSLHIPSRLNYCASFSATCTVNFGVVQKRSRNSLVKVLTDMVNTYSWSSFPQRTIDYLKIDEKLPIFRLYYWHITTDRLKLLLPMDSYEQVVATAKLIGFTIDRGYSGEYLHPVPGASKTQQIQLNRQLGEIIAREMHTHIIPTLSDEQLEYRSMLIKAATNGEAFTAEVCS